MDSRFTQNRIKSTNNQLSKTSDILLVSKSPDVEEDFCDNVVKIIDEKGNEISCTVEKFIEIFDNIGLEGFIL